jgi:hypothetical protein
MRFEKKLKRGKFAWMKLVWRWSRTWSPSGGGRWRAGLASVGWAVVVGHVGRNGAAPLHVKRKGREGEVGQLGKMAQSRICIFKHFFYFPDLIQNQNKFKIEQILLELAT